MRQRNEDGSSRRRLLASASHLQAAVSPDVSANTSCAACEVEVCLALVVTPTGIV